MQFISPIPDPIGLKHALVVVGCWLLVAGESLHRAGSRVPCLPISILLVVCLSNNTVRGFSSVQFGSLQLDSVCLHSKQAKLNSRSANTTLEPAFAGSRNVLFCSGEKINKFPLLVSEKQTSFMIIIGFVFSLSLILLKLDFLARSSSNLDQIRTRTRCHHQVSNVVNWSKAKKQKWPQTESTQACLYRKLISFCC